MLLKSMTRGMKLYNFLYTNLRFRFLLQSKLSTHTHLSYVSYELSSSLTLGSSPRILSQSSTCHPFNFASIFQQVIWYPSTTTIVQTPNNNRKKHWNKRENYKNEKKNCDKIFVFFLSSQIKQAAPNSLCKQKLHNNTGLQSPMC